MCESQKTKKVKRANTMTEEFILGVGHQEVNLV
jgi:hypothetical protein